MKAPIVAIVGRPNVGKSTFINRIIKSRDAIVHKDPGVTRDRKYFSTDWNGKEFILIDTGGLIYGDKYRLNEEIKNQALLATDEADVILFLVDGLSGCLGDDFEIAKTLRKTKKPVLLIVNKIDEMKKENNVIDFYRLGMEEPVSISAIHGRGIGDLLDKIVLKLPEIPENRKEKVFARVAIVGRPNVGKSSILNRLSGTERTIVSDDPGTTRDSVDTIITVNNNKYLFIDTAGIKSKKKEYQNLEFYSVIRSLKAIESADISFLVIDSLAGVLRQDKRISKHIIMRNSSLIILPNKWDLIDKKKAKEILRDIQDKFSFINYAPIHCISAKTGRGFKNIFPITKGVVGEFRKKITGSALNNLLFEIKNEGYTYSKGGKTIKPSYITQVSIEPP
ncbi:MAG: ribosome biogenesis GTPase Der, partial [Actinomycetia bacterium]|nr:ribosome biogenesis GTPase Der [Actinomycetes bacterium]